MMNRKNKLMILILFMFFSGIIRNSYGQLVSSSVKKLSYHTFSIICCNQFICKCKLGGWHSFVWRKLYLWFSSYGNSLRKFIYHLGRIGWKCKKTKITENKFSWYSYLERTPNYCRESNFSYRKRNFCLWRWLHYQCI